MKRLVVAILALYLTVSPVFALQLDMSIDEEIRKNYNPSKLERQNLPPLPKTATPTKTVTTQPKTTTSTTTTQTSAPPKTTPTVVDDFTAIKIKKGTKFRLKSNNLV